ncbi:SdiA-regulated/phytase-like domain-containing protein [Micromonospora sonneratiae]|uniref:Uncharacterized protein n=1 Tax=Micromonospora sonneratiae TaxID=1184706 RepID=A0ABW3YBG2_9ACTN
MLSVTVAAGLVATSVGPAFAARPQTAGRVLTTGADMAARATGGGAGALPVRAVVGAAQAARVCEITDERLDEISGMVATDNGYVVINDGADSASRRKIFFLNQACAVTRAVSYPSRPRDPEDLALAPDGTFWVADVGDNGASRETVALWKFAPGAKTPVIHRLSYPDGARDAEALVLAGDGTPIIITKDPIRPRLYAPVGPLQANQTVRLARVGEFRLPLTSTKNPFAMAGRVVVTGGANSPDGSRVVLRTYADALEFDVTDGDVVKAITQGKPKVVPLPDEPQGESITYTRDGRSLLTVSETTNAPAGTRPVILRYPSAEPTEKIRVAPTTAEPKPPSAVPTSIAAAPAPDDPAGGAPARASKFALAGVACLVGVAGLVLILIGGTGRLRNRRRVVDRSGRAGG